MSCRVCLVWWWRREYYVAVNQDQHRTTALKGLFGYKRSSDLPLASELVKQGIQECSASN